MRPIVTDRVAYGRSASRSVCLSVTVVSPAKTAEPIEKPFGLWPRMGPRNHVLDGVPIPMGNDNFKGEMGRPVVKYSDYHKSIVAAAAIL